MNPVSFDTHSTDPPVSYVITGVPQACASIFTNPRTSSIVGFTKTSAHEYQFRNSSTLKVLGRPKIPFGSSLICLSFKPISTILYPFGNFLSNSINVLSPFLLLHTAATPRIILSVIPYFSFSIIELSG